MRISEYKNMCKTSNDIILEKNYGRIKIYGGGYFVFDRDEVLGVEFI